MQTFCYFIIYEFVQALCVLNTLWISFLLMQLISGVAYLSLCRTKKAPKPCVSGRWLDNGSLLAPWINDATWSAKANHWGCDLQGYLFLQMPLKFLCFLLSPREHLPFIQAPLSCYFYVKAFQTCTETYELWAKINLSSCLLEVFCTVLSAMRNN